VREIKEKMQVLQIVEPGIDGVFRYVEGLIDYLMSSKIKVGLAYSDIRGSVDLDKLVKRLNDNDVPVVNLRVKNSPQPQDVSAFIALYRYCKKYKPTVIHAHSSKAGVLGRILSIVTGIPCIYTPHAYYGLGLNTRHKAIIFNTVERMLISVGQTINISKDEADFALKKLGANVKKQIIISGGVDTEKFCPGSKEEKLKWKEKNHLPSNSIILGTIGRLGFQKDPITLYKAFKIVSLLRDNIYLVHVGDGELSRECDEFIITNGLKDRVIRIKYASDTSLLYKIFDVFVLSSRYEGLPLAAMEALSSNLPIILTDAPGNRDFFNMNLSHIWRAGVEDSESLSLALEAYLNDSPNGRLINHREVAIKYFSKKVCFEKIIKIYNSKI